MSFDYRKLKGRIVEICGTQAAFAEELNISERSMSLKLNSLVPWKQSEIAKACKILEIADGDIAVYFFASKV